MAPYLPAQRPQCGVHPTPMESDLGDQGAEPSGLTRCFHVNGCRYLALIATDYADVNLACVGVCYDRAVSSR